MGSELEVVLRAKDFLSSNLEKAKMSVDGLNMSARKLQTTFGTALIATAAIAIAAGVRSIYNESVKMADGIAKGSDALGLSTKAYQEWDYVLKQNGSSMEAAQRGFHSISVKAYEAVTGSKAAAESFKLLGVNLKDTNGNLKTSSQLVSDTALALADIKNPAERAAIAQKLFGKSALELLPALSQGRNEIEELISKANSMGQVLSARAVRSLDEAGDAADAMGMAFKVLGAELTSTFAPAITATAEAIAKLAANFEKLKKDSEGDLIARINYIQADIDKLNDPKQQNWLQRMMGTWDLASEKGRKHMQDLQAELDGLHAKLMLVQSEENNSTGGKPTIKSVGEGGASTNKITAREQMGADNWIEQVRAKDVADAERHYKNMVDLEIQKQKWIDEIREADVESAKKRWEDLERGRAETERLAKESSIALTVDYATREREALNEHYRQLKENHAGNALALSNIDKAYAIDRMNLERSITEYRIMQAQQGLSAISQNLQVAASEFKEFGGAYKAFAIAQTMIDTYASATSSFKSLSGIPIVGPALGAAAAAAAVVAGLANVKKIAAQKFALGGDFITSGPMPIIVGDNPGGRERVQVTPLSSPNINGPKNGMTINLNIPAGAPVNSLTVDRLESLAAVIGDVLVKAERQGRLDTWKAMA